MYPNTRHRRAVSVFVLGLILISLSGLMVLLFSQLMWNNELTVFDLEVSTDTLLVGQSDEWKLILVNRQNPIPADYKVNLIHLQDGQAVDTRIYPALQQMFDAADAEGILLCINSSYRTAEEQQAILDEKIAAYKADGNNDEEARNLAEQWVALPGTSEHQLGMAVDLSTPNSWIQDADSLWTWLIENSYKYGFIQRYPADKSAITGIANEPWHYRYVGQEAAKGIHELGICLEEYLAATETA